MAKVNEFQNWIATYPEMYNPGWWSPQIWGAKIEIKKLEAENTPKAEIYLNRMLSDCFKCHISYSIFNTPSNNDSVRI